MFYPVRQQVSQQGFQRNKNVFQQYKKQLTMLRNLYANRIKRFYSVENLVQKPVGEQDKIYEFSQREDLASNAFVLTLANGFNIRIHKLYVKRFIDDLYSMFRSSFYMKQTLSFVSVGYFVKHHVH